jgi:hypothetical protein
MQHDLFCSIDSLGSDSTSLLLPISSPPKTSCNSYLAPSSPYPSSSSNTPFAPSSHSSSPNQPSNTPLAPSCLPYLLIIFLSSFSSPLPSKKPAWSEQ